MTFSVYKKRPNCQRKATKMQTPFNKLSLEDQFDVVKNMVQSLPVLISHAELLDPSIRELICKIIKDQMIERIEELDNTTAFGLNELLNTNWLTGKPATPGTGFNFCGDDAPPVLNPECMLWGALVLYNYYES